MKYACPNCGQQLTYSKDNPFRPFCSERCRLIDLGEWASEGHKIGGTPAEDELLSEELESIFRVSKIDPQ